MIGSCLYYFPMFLFSGITAIRIMLKESGHIILCSTAVRLYKVIHKSWYIWHSPVPGNIFRWDFHFLRLILMALNFHGNWFFFQNFKRLFLFRQCLPQKIQVSAFRRTVRQKLGVFSKFMKFNIYFAVLLSS